MGSFSGILYKMIDRKPYGGTPVLQKREKRKRELPIESIIALILLLTLILSLIFSIIRFFTAPETLPDGAPYRKIKSDYLLMITQCLLGIAVMTLPTFINHRWKLMLPGVMCILYYIFLYCAVVLGEIFSFYYKIPHWDSMLHAMSGAMLGALGFIIVDRLNRDPKVKLSMSPIFVSLFAFSFALSIGALWEIYEFSFDFLLGLNMQKFKKESGAPLIGQYALADTMKDLIIDAVSAASVAVIGYLTSIKDKKTRKDDQDELYHGQQE